jgi:endonuclease YncB( thermonuclease family)
LARAEEPSYSDKKCQESPACPTLLNRKEDYSIEGVVERVIDADTLEVKLFVLPGLEYTIAVRSRGVDAPETNRPACEAERVLGEKAAASVGGKFGPGRPVRLSDIETDKFGGRIVAQIDRWDSDRMKSLSEELLETGQAVPYIAGQDHNWCEG